MARTLTSDAQNKIAQTLGAEPILIVEIQWTPGGSIFQYAERDLTGVLGRILSSGPIDNTVVVQGVQSAPVSDSQSISIQLDDSDSTIKTIMDANDIHKRPAWVYQYFAGLDIATDKFLIFKGEINSPMRWDEGDRSVTLDIITKIEDREVGFSLEEGDFFRYPQELIGKPWPLVFGSVNDSPALRLVPAVKGTLLSGFGIRDYILEPMLEQLGEACCPLNFVGYAIATQAAFSFGVGGIEVRQIPQYRRDASCACKWSAQHCTLSLELARQVSHESATLQIHGGQFFAQGVQIALNIKGARLVGYFNGTDAAPSQEFIVTNRLHPKRILDNPKLPEIKTYFRCTVGATPEQEVFKDPRNAYQVCNLDDACRELPRGSLSRGVSVQFGPADGASGGSDGSAPGFGFTSTRNANNNNGVWDHLSTFEKAGFFWAEGGSEVLLDELETVYVVNLLPSTVHYVKAWRTFPDTNVRQLTTVPSNLYTVRQVDMGDYTTTEIVFTSPLTGREEGWEEQLYVTLTSSIGPNPVDIMEWLITTYAPALSWDASFAAVKTLLAGWDMNFLVPGRMDILALLKEIAFQSCCAISLRNDTFHLTFLPLEPVNDGTITEDDVLANSLVLSHTSTEDIVTKIIAEWRPSLALEEPFRLITRFNEERYGILPQTFDFFCYNSANRVRDAIQFWAVRMGTTWRIIECKTPLTKLALENLDGVYVTLDDIADGTIRCRIETATYNSTDNSIDFSITTPVRAGSRVPYPWAYPIAIGVDAIAPPDELFAQGSPNVDVGSISGTVLGTQAQYNESQRINFPDHDCDSLFIDLYNECYPEPEPEDNRATDPETPSSSGPSSSDFANQKAIADNHDRIAELLESILSEADANSELEALQSLPTPDDLDFLGICHWDVHVWGHEITRVTTNSPEPGDTSTEEGATGQYVGNFVQTLTEIVSFGSYEQARAYRDQVLAVRDSDATVGKWHPVNALVHQLSISPDPDPCDLDETAEGPIGFSREEDFDEGLSNTAAGYKGLLTEGFTGWDPS